MAGEFGGEEAGGFLPAVRGSHPCCREMLLSSLLSWRGKGSPRKERKDWMGNFIQGVDYQTVLQKEQRSESGKFNGGGATCLLTLSCLEFFIARKVCPVFGVYRAVFHRAATMRMPLVYAGKDKVSAH